MKIFKAITNSGKEYKVEFFKPNTFDLTENIYDNPRGYIFVNEEKFLIPLKNIDNVPFVWVSKYRKDLMDELNVPKKLRKNNIKIKLNKNFESDYKNFVDGVLEGYKKEANNANFTKLEVSKRTGSPFNIVDWDSEKDNSLINFNDRIKELVKYTDFVDEKLFKDFIKETDIGDYSTTVKYEIPFEDFEKIALSGKGEFFKVKKEKEEKETARKEKSENIKNGAVYFSCETKPRNVKKGEILNSPAPEGGSYVLEHKLDGETFSKIKKFGNYYSKEFLEDVDMFYSSPGWRFSKKAIDFLKDSTDVYVDEKLV